jgi:hypothetical protein
MLGYSSKQKYSRDDNPGAFWTNIRAGSSLLVAVGF